MTALTCWPFSTRDQVPRIRSVMLVASLRVDLSGRQLENDLVGCVDFGWRQHGDDDDDEVLIAVEVL